MKIVSNIDQYPELKIDEQNLKNCIRKHYSTIKAPIFIYVDKRLHLAHGLHRCADYRGYRRLPSIVSENIMPDIKKNKGHFHKVSLSYHYMMRAKKNCKDCEEWLIPKGFDYYYSYLMFLISHELQHAYQTEKGIQYKKKNWEQYADRIYDHTPTEYDAEVAAIIKGSKLIRSYYDD